MSQDEGEQRYNDRRRLAETRLEFQVTGGSRRPLEKPDSCNFMSRAEAFKFRIPKGFRPPAQGFPTLGLRQYVSTPKRVA